MDLKGQQRIGPVGCSSALNIRRAWPQRAVEVRGALGQQHWAGRMAGKQRWKVSASQR